MPKHHRKKFLTDFLNNVPDVPEREELRKIRVGRFLTIDELQYQTAFAHELMALCNQLEELAFALDNMEETLAACRAAREIRTNRQERGEDGRAVKSAARKRPPCTPVARGEPDVH